MIRGKVVLYTGRRGVGKTLTMVTEGFKYWKNGVDVYRNFSAKFGKEISKRHLARIDEHGISNCVVMIDELHLFFDSREFMKRTNVDFSHFLAKLRKRNVIVMGTVQFKDNTEYRIRQHCDVEASMRTSQEHEVVECIYVDKTKVENNFLMDETDEIFNRMFTDDTKLPYVRVYYDVSDVFEYDLYDTDEDPTER